MSPHRPAQRQSASEGTQTRIVDAARELLADPEATVDFTVDAVAKRAGVSRMTVYYQFGGRAALLEAVLDNLADRVGLTPEIAAAMQRLEPGVALDQVVAVFIGFWAAHRLAIRRLRAMAVLDPELAGVFRDERRRMLIAAALNRGDSSAARGPVAEQVVDLLLALTSFETYDTLASASADERRVVQLVQRACAVLLSANLGPPI